MKIIILAATLSLIPVWTGAQSMVTDRPSQSNAASTVGPGVLHVESGFTFTTEESGNYRSDGYSLPATVLRYGWGRNFEWRAVTEPRAERLFYSGDSLVRKTFGIADLQAGFKVMIFKTPSGKDKMALTSHLIFPTGNREFAGNTGFTGKLSMTHSFSAKHSLSCNVGLDYYSGEESGFLVALLWSISPAGNLSVFVEPYLLGSDNDAKLNADAGFAYLITGDLQVDYSFGFGVANSLMNFHSLGFSFRLPASKGKIN